MSLQPHPLLTEYQNSSSHEISDWNRASGRTGLDLPLVGRVNSSTRLSFVPIFHTAAIGQKTFLPVDHMVALLQPWLRQIVAMNCLGEAKTQALLKIVSPPQDPPAMISRRHSENIWWRYTQGGVFYGEQVAIDTRVLALDLVLPTVTESSLVRIVLAPWFVRVVSYGHSQKNLRMEEF